MSKERITRSSQEDDDRSGRPEEDGSRLPGGDVEDDSSFTVKDRRHWTQDEAEAAEEAGEPATVAPSIIVEFRERAESAERKLQEYIDAFKSFKEEQERFRARAERDVQRNVDLKFGDLAAELLETMDHLDLGLSHVDGVAGAEPLAQGVTMARDRFIAALERFGIERILSDGCDFDPNEAEAMRVDAVGAPELDGKVTETLQPGYRLGQRVLRAARVAVGRYTSSGA